MWETLLVLQEMTHPGISTKELEKRAYELLKKRGAHGSFLGFGGYPSVLCASVNEEIVHMPPSDKALKDGDILSLDFGVKYKGLYTDAALTFGVGKISTVAEKLIKAAKKSLAMGLENVREGATTGDIGYAVQNYAEGEGFSVIRELVGHGVGYGVHEDPRIPNFGKREDGDTLKSGMVIAVEPMISVGDWRITQTDDGFGYKTIDSSLSAHFEHTVLVTKDGFEILTTV